MDTTAPPKFVIATAGAPGRRSVKSSTASPPGVRPNGALSMRVPKSLVMAIPTVKMRVAATPAPVPQGVGWVMVASSEAASVAEGSGRDLAPGGGGEMMASCPSSRTRCIPAARGSSASTAASPRPRPRCPRGPTPHSAPTAPSPPPRLFVPVDPFTPLRPEVYTQGVACVTVDVRRDNPEAKDTRFIAAATDAYAHLPAGVEEGLLLGEEGEVLEGLSSNFLAVLDGVLRTEDARALPGVTRALVLELAAMRLPVVRRAVRRDELPRLSEAFITSVSREVLPVVRIDGQPVGDGHAGPWA